MAGEQGSVEQIDLLIVGGTVITQNAEREIVPNGAVAVRGCRIAAVGPAPELASRYSAVRTLDFTGRYLFPGLINTHAHLFQTFAKGLGEGLLLYDWVQAVTGPTIEAMTPRDAYLATILGGLESVRSGVTTLLDYQYPLNDPEMPRGFAQGFVDLGLRGILGLGLTETGEHHGLPPYLFIPVSEALAGWDARIAEIGSDPRAQEMLSFCLSPAIPFGITRGGLEAMRAYATERNMLISMHINETPDDDQAILADHGLRAIPFLEAAGFLGPDVLAVHCVRMEPEDIEILSRHDVKVSHNPVSNMYLGSGCAPVVKMRQAGITVSLATDGAASNNSQDMLETLKCAGLIHKLYHRDPSAMTASDVLDMATIDGARAIGQGDRLGSLEPGKQADLFVMDPVRVKSVPVLDPVASLVFSSGQGNIVTTVVAGRVLLDEGQIITVDEEALLLEAQAAAERVAKDSGAIKFSVQPPSSSLPDGEAEGT
jgi:5-methylthioadenosine/S-adenosylhomocysteine deaminase